MGLEVYVGRIYAHTLNYNTEENMVNNYFSKVHSYRTGNLYQPWRGLEYVDEDWYDMNVNLDHIYNENITRYDYGYYTTANDYLDQMDLGQNFVQVCAHSYSGGHHFSTKPTESAAYAHLYVYSPSNRNAKLLIGYNDGIKVWLNGENIYTNDRYGEWIPDQSIVNINLVSGWNRLLFKISQLGGKFEFSAKITNSVFNTFTDLKYQINNPDIYGEESPYIRSWLLNGFHQDISDNFWNYLSTNYLDVEESSIQPIQGEIMGGKEWQLYDSGSPYINLDEFSNNADFGVVYAFSKINVISETNCQLWMGYDDGARIWLNSEEIIFDNKYGDFESDSKKVDVTLNEGENYLLVKISEWMGGHGFSARFCNYDGSTIEDISFTPEQTPITYIGHWLINGPYLNPDQNLRLETDYLEGENNISPSEGDIAPINQWERAVINSYPTNLASFFDKGDWVYSDTIQERDPPVLFYNLFSCGPGRFTDNNYLAGSYIFDTTFGLITIASSKSGSMLYFNDFTKPLGEGKSFGDSFFEWFNDQAPYSLWEKEWYYGMVLNGDPTLRILQSDSIKPYVSIIKPENGIYFKDSKILPFFIPFIIGEITVELSITENNNEIDYVEFMLDNNLIFTDFEEPYSFQIDEQKFGNYELKIIVYDKNNNIVFDQKNITLFNFGIFK
jgi:hypothetical protein